MIYFDILYNVNLYLQIRDLSSEGVQIRDISDR